MTNNITSEKVRLKTNRLKVIKQSIKGEIHHPVNGKNYKIESNGIPKILPSTGGITYNIHVGDSVYGLAGDHIEPSVSIKNKTEAENDSLMALSCLGNQATVVSGDAKGAKGYVLGGHGGINHTIIEFSEADMDKMTIGDEIQIKGYGQGLQLLDYEEIHVMNIDPDLLEQIDIMAEVNHIVFPVASTIPGKLMGSGIGASHSYSGDCDLMSQDIEMIKRYNLDILRFGDFVLIENWDSRYGRSYIEDIVTIGIVVHSDSIKNGHGPGIMSLMSGKKSELKGVISEKCNVKDYIKIK